MKTQAVTHLTAALIAGAFSASALACASCGCTLSSDWESQGFTTEPGLKVDVRYDYLNQNQLRHNRSSLSPGAASQLTNSNGDPYEIERYTRNNYLTVGFDYAFNADWGINLQLPYVHRSHSTLGVGSDGSVPANGAYDSQTSNLGDVKVIARYQGFTDQHNVGVMAGLKLPTGNHTLTAVAVDGSTVSIDRGLQPGTGTTDMILGAYTFDALNKNWDYFAQATVQAALNSKDDYKPGTGYNVNVGVRYLGLERVTPQIQINARHVRHDTGANADTVSTGGTLVYLSPGLVVPVTEKTSVYGFVQLPIYQDVRGVQLTPKYIASVGARFSF